MTTVSLLANASLFVLIVNSQAQAQLATAANISDITSSTVTVARRAGEIVVTAQRHEENLQNVAITVTVISDDTLRSRPGTDVSALICLVPGFDFQMTSGENLTDESAGQAGHRRQWPDWHGSVRQILSTSNGIRPAMRGVRTGSIDVNADPPIGYFVDGNYQDRTSQASIGFIDIAPVEVQREPQGTLYGRSTFGRNIIVTTNAPTHDFDYMSLSAVMMNDAVFDILADEQPRRGTYGHGYTYAGHPVACAVVLEALDFYAERDLVGHVEEVTPVFRQHLAALSKHCFVGKTRAISLIGAIRAFADRDERRAFPPEGKRGGAVARSAQELGLIVRRLGQDTIALCLPLLITSTKIQRIFDQFDHALNTA